MKAYIVYKNKELCDIEQCDIIKETEKTYIVRLQNSYCNYMVKKVTMQFGDFDKKFLCLTLEDAENAQRQFLLNKWRDYKSQIELYKTFINKIEKFFKDKGV